MKASAAARGYGAEHRRLRRVLEPWVRSGAAVCARCGEQIVPGAAWDLGHRDDRLGWSGPEHAGCNRSAGARTSVALRRGRVDPAPPPGW